ncbi:hypothetical protein [Photobacterium minamisatsumaniensis]|uniref:hypothetical protein n=1 Tax=Photobacterium minamisatsumaniensis TaxID=2910233 RepID=UPI003D1523A2
MKKLLLSALIVFPAMMVASAHAAPVSLSTEGNVDAKLLVGGVTDVFVVESGVAVDGKTRNGFTLTPVEAEDSIAGMVSYIITDEYVTVSCNYFESENNYQLNVTTKLKGNVDGETQKKVVSCSSGDKFERSYNLENKKIKSVKVTYSAS